MIEVDNLLDLGAAIRAESARVGYTSIQKIVDASGVSRYKVNKMLAGDETTPIGNYIVLAEKLGLMIKFVVRGK